MLKTLVACLSKERADFLELNNGLTLNIKCNSEKLLFVERTDSQLIKYKELADKYAWQLIEIGPKLFFNFTCDYIINYAYENGYDNLLLFDDDLELYKLANNAINFKNYNYNYDINDLINITAILLCEQIPYATVPYAFARINMQNLIDFNKMITQAYFIHVKTFMHNKLFFTCEEVMWHSCDIVLLLDVLLNGFITARINLYTTGNNVLFSNPGGSSIYRTEKIIDDSIHALKHKYTDYISNIDTHNKFKTYTKKAFNKEKFKARFGIDANVFAKNKLIEIEDFYNKELLNNEHYGK